MAEHCPQGSPSSGASGNGYRTVFVAVSTVGVVQVPVHEIVDMVAMRDRFMPAAWAVPV